MSHTLPTVLSLPGLATHYRVSLTPVRHAIRILLAEGLLVRAANGRLAVAKEETYLRPDPACLQEAGHNGVREKREESPAARPEMPASRAGSAPDWEARLMLDIVIRSLQGEVAYLREEAASEHYGIGRTALRAAFGRLAGKGMLEHVPRCGWRGRAFDAADLRAYLTMREVLELKALDLALPHLDPQRLRSMRDGNTISADNTLARLDNGLHRYLIELSGNAYIHDFFERHGLYYATLFDFAAPEAHVVNEMALQHRAILDAMIRQDRAAAQEALARHIQAQYPIVQQLLETLNAMPLRTDEPTQPDPKEKAL